MKPTGQRYIFRSADQKQAARYDYKYRKFMVNAEPVRLTQHGQQARDDQERTDDNRHLIESADDER